MQTIVSKEKTVVHPVPTTLAMVSLTGEGGLATPYINMAAEEAVELAITKYAISGKVTRFATEKDDTFRLQTSEGLSYVLKVANPAEPIEELQLQTDLLAHILHANPMLPIPRVALSKHGEPISSLIDRAGQRRHVRLMSYLDGIPLDSTGSSTVEREKVGAMLARLRLATAKFSHPGASRVLAWDVLHLPSLAGLLEGVENQERRTRLTAGMERFISLHSRIRNLRTQILHNDFSRSNIVVNHTHPEFVTGIIDFGDAVQTAIAIDVSTALLNQLPRCVGNHPKIDLFKEGRDVLRGYQRVADLNQEELALIPHLTMGRVVARTLLTLWRAKLFPDNQEYILRNTEQGWAQLDWFLARSIDEVSSIFSH
jgi:hydroxylysine kinase